MLPSNKLAELLKTSAGIERIVNEQWKEEDNLDFKREVNRRDKHKWQADLRVDCAALASTGVGFLVIGVDDTHDGSNRAKAISPVQDPVNTKRAIEHTLADGFSPRLDAWEVWIIETTHGPVIVVRVEGTRGYPLRVLDPPLNKERHYLRGAGQNQPLSEEEARLCRREFDVRNERNRVLRKINMVGIVVLILAGVALFGFDSFRRHREEALAVDAGMCGIVRDDGGLKFIDDTLWNLKIEGDAALWEKDVQGCWRLHEKLLKLNPQHSWRYFWAGQCNLLAGDTGAADEQFALSEQIAERAEKSRPSCGNFKLLRVLNAYARKREIEACNLLRDFHADGSSASLGSSPPMQRLSVTCQGMTDVLAKLGLAIPAVALSDITDRWPVDAAQRSRVFKQAVETNNYDLLVCSKTYPVDPKSVTASFEIVISQSGAVLEAGPSADVDSGAATAWENLRPGRKYLNCVGCMMLDWRLPPHAFSPAIKVGVQ